MIDKLDRTQKLVITFLFAINFGGGVAAFDSWTAILAYFVFSVVAAACLGLLYVAIGRWMKESTTTAS